LTWNIVEPRDERLNTVTTFGPVTVSFAVKVNKPLRSGGHHTIGLYNKDNQLMWGTEAYNFKLEQGTHELIYKLSSLPLYPGSYSWRIGVYNESGVLDLWEGYPELIIGTKPATNTSDQWTGILNLPYEFYIESN
jgi:hypothetical protein